MKSVKQQLAEVGVTIDYTRGAWDNKMMMKDGKDLGHFTPLEALREFTDYDGETEREIRNKQ